MIGANLALRFLLEPVGQPWLGSTFAVWAIVNTVALAVLGHSSTPAAEVTR